MSLAARSLSLSTIPGLHRHEADLFSVVGVETLIKEALHRPVEMSPHAGKLVPLIGVGLQRRDSNAESEME